MVRLVKNEFIQIQLVVFFFFSSGERVMKADIRCLFEGGGVSEFVMSQETYTLFIRICKSTEKYLDHGEKRKDVHGNGFGMNGSVHLG